MAINFWVGVAIRIFLDRVGYSVLPVSSVAAQSIYVLTRAQSPSQTQTNSVTIGPPCSPSVVHSVRDSAHIDGLPSAKLLHLSALQHCSHLAHVPNDSKLWRPLRVYLVLEYTLCFSLHSGLWLPWFPPSGQCRQLWISFSVHGCTLQHRNRLHSRSIEGPWREVQVNGQKHWDLKQAKGELIALSFI